MEKLALEGGTPVRKTEFPTHMLGASLIGQEELKELADVVREKSPFRHYGIGNPNKVKTLEAMFEQRFGCKYALAVSSGSAALLRAVAALGLGLGDEVIIPSFAWYTDYCVLAVLGITPVFADIGDDLNMDPADFERKITSKTKAVIPVHYQGAPAKMDEIVRIARAHNLFLIEDCAQALGGTYHGKLLGTFGDIAITSFQTHKMITAGEGGMVFTDNEELFARAVRYHDLGNIRPFFESKLEHKELASRDRMFAGLQLRMSELQGAFLCAQLRRLDGILEKCRGAHKRIREHFAGNPNFTIRYEEGDCGIAFIMLMPTKEIADRFSAAMNAEGIPCGPTSFCCNLVADYPVKNKGLANSKMPPFGPGFDAEDVTYDPAVICPHTDDYVARFVAIGLGPLYTEQEIDDIIHALEKVIAAVF